MSGEDDEPLEVEAEVEVEVVASVGALDATVVLLREFLHASGALRAVAVVERPDGEGEAVVDCGRLAPIEVDLGERLLALPHAIELDAPVPALPEVRQLPPFEVDAAAGSLAGPLGGAEHLARAVRALAELLGGQSVALVQFETTDPGAPLAITARAGGAEPLVLALGEEEFEMQPGWPPA
jgi:hypothetical protein